MGRIVTPIHGRGEEELNDGTMPSLSCIMQGRGRVSARTHAWRVGGQNSAHERLIPTRAEVHEACAPPTTRDGVGGD